MQMLKGKFQILSIESEWNSYDTKRTLFIMSLGMVLFGCFVAQTKVPHS